MSGMNVVILTGRVGQDARCHVFEGDRAVIEFSIATSEKYKDRSGEWVEKTIWHNCKKYGKVEKLAQYIRQGDMLNVRGSVDEETWTKDGEEKKRTIVKVDDVVLLGTKNDRAAGKPQGTGGGFDDDDIPF